MNNNGYKAQYKVSANGSWQTQISGTEQSAMAALQRLQSKYPFTRVVDSTGRVVS